MAEVCFVFFSYSEEKSQGENRVADPSVGRLAYKMLMLDR